MLLFMHEWKCIAIIFITLSIHLMDLDFIGLMALVMVFILFILALQMACWIIKL